MKRWPNLFFLDIFTVFAVVILIIHYGFDSGLPQRRVNMSWAVVGLQIIVNATNWWIASRRSATE